MKNVLMSGLVVAIIGLTSATFAKSKAKSSKSSSKQSSSTSGKQSTTASSKPSQDAAGKQTTDTSKDKQSQNHKNKKTHRCRLPDGKIDSNKSQQECLKANGKWVKY